MNCAGEKMLMGDGAKTNCSAGIKKHRWKRTVHGGKVGDWRWERTTQPPLEQNCYEWESGVKSQHVRGPTGKKDEQGTSSILDNQLVQWRSKMDYIWREGGTLHKKKKKKTHDQRGKTGTQILNLGHNVNKVKGKRLWAKAKTQQRWEVTQGWVSVVQAPRDWRAGFTLQEKNKFRRKGQQVKTRIKAWCSSDQRNKRRVARRALNVVRQGVAHQWIGGGAAGGLCIGTKGPITYEQRMKP